TSPRSWPRVGSGACSSAAWPPTTASRPPCSTRCARAWRWSSWRTRCARSTCSPVTAPARWPSWPPPARRARGSTRWAERTMRGVEHIPWAYDAICAFAEWRGLARWRHWLVAGARGRTLDLGCGTGRNLPLYARDVRPIGVDPAADSLARARRRAPGALLVRASAEALPFRDGVFDTVVAGLVLCSVSDPPRALAEARRVLLPDG